MVWAGLFKDQITGSFFFENGPVNGNSYLELLADKMWPVFKAVFPHEEQFAILQQDGAPAHYDKKKCVTSWMIPLKTDGWEEVGLSSANRSPDLTPIDFWFAEYRESHIRDAAEHVSSEIKSLLPTTKENWRDFVTESSPI